VKTVSEDIIAALKENVIQGRATSEDEGLMGDMAGQPAVAELTEQALKKHIDVQKLIKEGLTEAMQVVGDKFSTKEFFIPDMLASAEAVTRAMDILRPHLEKSGVEPKGKFVIATVKGDLHDIGKNIVSILLRGAGYIVKDLGNNLEPQDIVEAVRKEKPEFLALSALLTSTMVYMGDTIEVLKKSGLRDQVKIIVGGAPVSEEFAGSIGADAYGADGFQAVAIVETLSSVITSH
jgi:5-methyltetrahydrofolate--homocysteine methyltransferase